MITATATHTESMTVKDIVLVNEIDFANMVVKSIGTRKPSSESMMHAKIYEKFPNIEVVFHGHLDSLLEKSGHDIDKVIRILDVAREMPLNPDAWLFYLLYDLFQGKELDELITNCSIFYSTDNVSYDGLKELWKQYKHDIFNDDLQRAKELQEIEHGYI